MRRETVRLDVSNVAWLSEDGEPRQPTLTVTVTDGAADVRDRFQTRGEATIDASDVDVTFRFREDEESGRDGVMAITNRLTGEFLVESNVPASEVMEFVSAARRYAERTDDAARYRARVVVDDEPLADVEKRTLLVYSNDGELLRQRSLIPSGVEI